MELCVGVCLVLSVHMRACLCIFWETWGVRRHDYMHDRVVRGWMSLFAHHRDCGRGPSAIPWGNTQGPAGCHVTA